MNFNVKVHIRFDSPPFILGSIHVEDWYRFLELFRFQSFGSDVVLIDKFPVALQSRKPSLTISIPHSFSLEIFIGKYIELFSTQATKHEAIDKMLGDTDVEAVLHFKNLYCFPVPGWWTGGPATPWFLLGIRLEGEHVSR
jgi:hypothetical protein